MPKLKSFIFSWIKAFLLPRPIVGIFYIPKFFSHYVKYHANAKEKKSLPLSLLDMQPCLGDWTSHTPFDSHYFYQGAWLARRVLANKVEHHFDIASSALTISVLSAAVKTTFIDYRPLKTNLSNLECLAGDILNLPFENDSINSLSCLHVIEHIGLGRYGDPINANGSVEAAKQLQRVLAKNGKLYLALPIGQERICYNAHRVHSPDTVVKMFSDLNLLEFSYVCDEGNYHENQTLSSANNLNYGCGLFIFEKL